MESHTSKQIIIEQFTSVYSIYSLSLLPSTPRPLKRLRHPTLPGNHSYNGPVGNAYKDVGKPAQGDDEKTANTVGTKEYWWTSRFGAFLQCANEGQNCVYYRCIKK
jgi:hypothetical protein